MDEVGWTASLDLARSPGFPVLAKVMTVLGKERLGGYLVGGYIRDILLQRPTADIDIALVELDLNRLRDLAGEMNGSFVLLDEFNKVARVVLREDGGRQWNVDFSALRGTIEDDLRERDFTINSLAAPLETVPAGQTVVPVIDPLGGRADMGRRMVRAVSDRVFSDDPGRLLRAIRFAAELDFAIDAHTEALVREHAGLLSGVSGERVRFELVRVLEAPGTYFWLRYMDKVGLLGVLFPELNESRNVEQPKEHHWDVFNHSLETVRTAEQLLAGAGRDSDDIVSAVPWTPGIRAHFKRATDTGASRTALLKLAALFHDVAKPRTRTREGERWRFLGHQVEGARLAEGVMQRLRFSRRETETVVAEIRHHMRPGQLHHEGLLPTRRAIYRYFRDTGSVALDTLFLSLADHLAARGPGLDRQEWEGHVRTVDYLVQQKEAGEKTVSPPRLIDGHDLIKVLGMRPGPDLGKILEEVREAQASGEVRTREEALVFARNLVSSPPAGED
ncbi:MAG: CCA tRNA nucleotidyltransferase [Chloroflexi bacterium]|nr:CCA tRNA nucleotidyltransferase [Chloroflexota bacterium]